MTWAFFATCLSLAAPTELANLVSLPVLRNFTPLSSVFYYINYTVQLGIAGLPIFLLRFPHNSAPGWRRPVLIFALCTVPWVLPLIFFAIQTDAALEKGPLLKSVIFLISFIILAVMGVQARGADRKRLQWVIVGVAAAIIAALLQNAPLFSGMASPGYSFITLSGNIVSFVSSLLYALMPICIFYAIIKHRVIDVRFIANRSIVFGIMLMLFTGAFAGLDWLFSAYVYQSQAQIAIGMAVAVALGWAIRSWRKPCIDFVDRILFPKSHAGLAALHDLRLTLERESSQGNVREVLTKTAPAALQLASAAIFARAADGGFIRETEFGWGAGTAWHLFAGDPVVDSISARRAKPFRVEDPMWAGVNVPTGLASPVLAIPLIAHRKVIALIFYGAHANGADINPDEERLLVELCVAAAPAFDQRETSGIGALPALAADATRTV